MLPPRRSLAATQLGVRATDLYTLDQPTNTFEEASTVKKEFGIDRKIILVTSALHMHRATRIFESLGLKYVPSPTNYLIKKDQTEGPKYDLLSYDNFYKIEVALHEYIGILWLKWRQAI